jgi:hypothetical protein
MSISARRWSCLLAIAFCVAMTSCKTDPKKTEMKVKELEPKAAAAAQERGRLDLNCEQVTSTVLSHDASATQTMYSLFRPEYRVATQGCGKRIVFTVVCSDEGICNAMSQSSSVESVK